MNTRADLGKLLCGADPKLRRMLKYWAATVMMSTTVVALMFGRRALAGEPAVLSFCAYVATGVALFYPLVRAGGRLGLSATTLAGLQGLFSITCDLWSYAIAGPLRGAVLMGLMVVIVFCSFALRPRQTLLLTAVGVLAMGSAMWWHAARDPLHFPPMVEGVTFAVTAISTLAVTFLTGEMSKLRARLKTQKEELAAALGTIRTLATTDELTSLANRRHMNELLAAEERREPAPGQPVCIALLDLDFFKQINDRHGHATGDEVLRRFAACAREKLRAHDVLARWGGEEFLLMLPDTAPGDALAVLARLRTCVARLEPAGVAFERPLTFSGGLTTREGREPLAATVNRADQALYQAKSAGRDRVVLY